MRFSNLLQVCLSVAPFVFDELFHVLSGYFYVSLSLVEVPTI